MPYHYTGDLLHTIDVRALPRANHLKFSLLRHSAKTDTFRQKDAMGHERFCTVLLEQLSESRSGIRSMKIDRHRLVISRMVNHGHGTRTARLS